jgi:hypothetical protein
MDKEYICIGNDNKWRKGIKENQGKNQNIKFNFEFI